MLPTGMTYDFEVKGIPTLEGNKGVRDIPPNSLFLIDETYGYCDKYLVFKQENDTYTAMPLWKYQDEKYTNDKYGVLRTLPDVNPDDYALQVKYYKFTLTDANLESIRHYTVSNANTDILTANAVTYDKGGVVTLVAEELLIDYFLGDIISHPRGHELRHLVRVTTYTAPK